MLGCSSWVAKLVPIRGRGFCIFPLDFALSKNFIFSEDAIESWASDPKDFGSLSFVIVNNFENVADVATLNYLKRTQIPATPRHISTGALRNSPLRRNCR